MSAWDTSALVKLYMAETDSARFQNLIRAETPLIIAHITLYEARVVFRRSEAEGRLPRGETRLLMADIAADIASGRIVVQEENMAVARQFEVVLEKCLSQVPPAFVRTNDALHLASALVAGEAEFITADERQRLAAGLMNLSVQP